MVSFDYRCVNTFLDEGVKGKKQQQLEITRLSSDFPGLSFWRRRESLPDLEKVLRKHSFGDRLIVDLDPFSDTLQIRRGVQPDSLGKSGSETVSMEERPRECARAALPFGAGNMNYVQVVDIILL